MTAASQDRILVADDDGDIRDLVVFKLTQAGYDVEAVQDGAAAFQSIDIDVDAGFATGASDYVIKPFSPRELLHRVNALVARTGV